MNLWVSSQDKEKLLKIDGIQYQNCKLVENETVEANILIGFYSSYENEILGEYNTKERAIEILDEIQNKMLNGVFTKKINGLGEELDLIPNTILIYNMPEK